MSAEQLEFAMCVEQPPKPIVPLLDGLGVTMRSLVDCVELMYEIYRDSDEPLTSKDMSFYVSLFKEKYQTFYIYSNAIQQIAYNDYNVIWAFSEYPGDYRAANGMAAHEFVRQILEMFDNIYCKATNQPGKSGLKALEQKKEEKLDQFLMRVFDTLSAEGLVNEQKTRRS